MTSPVPQDPTTAQVVPDRPVRRLSTVTIDQAIAGGSNVLVAVIAARLLDPASFGLFGIVFLVYVTGQGAFRALVCEPLLITSEEARRRPGEVLGTALMVGAGLGLVGLLVGLVARTWSPPLGLAFAVLGVTMAFLGLQDVGRYLGIALRRPGRAVELDVLWLALMVLGAAVLLVRGDATLPLVTAVWAGSGAVASVRVLGQYRGSRPSVRLTWLRESWRYAWRYLSSFAVTQGGVLAATIALAALAGAATVGGVRGALLLMSVATTLQIALGASGVNDISRLDDTDRIIRHARRISVVAGAAALVNGIAVLLLPAVLGRLALGETWDVADPLLLPAVVQVVLLGLLLGPRAGLLGTRAVRTALVVDIALTPPIVAAAVVGALVAGGLGYYWAVVGVQAVGVAIWWFVFMASVRRRRPSGPVPRGDAG